MKAALATTCVLVALLAAAQPSAAQVSGRATTARSPAAYICEDPELTTLCQLIESAGNGQGATTLKSGTSLATIFAPTDKAFQEDGKDVARELKLRDIDDVFTQPTAADRLLRMLIIPDQALLSTAFKNDAKYKNMLRKDLEYDVAWFTSQVYIKSSKKTAEITKKDIRAGQSVIHIVNRVPYTSV